MTQIRFKLRGLSYILSQNGERVQRQFEANDFCDIIYGRLLMHICYLNFISLPFTSSSKLTIPGLYSEKLKNRL